MNERSYRLSWRHGFWLEVYPRNDLLVYDILELLRRMGYLGFEGRKSGKLS
jgi:hypothetical protein